MNGYRLPRLYVFFTPIRCVLFGEQPRPPPPPYLALEIEPEADGQNISRVRAVYARQDQLWEETLEDSFSVGDVCLHMENTEGGTLAEKLGNYLSSLPPESLAALASCYEGMGKKNFHQEQSDFPPADGAKNILQEEAGCVFLAGLSCYLGFSALLEAGAFWDALPLQWTPPAPVRSGNALNQNAFNYTGLPLFAVTKLSSGLESQVAQALCGFFNSFGHLFGQGPILDSQRLVVEIISGFAAAASERLGELASARAAFMSDLACLRKEALEEMRRASAAEITRQKSEMEGKAAQIFAAFGGRAAKQVAEIVERGKKERVEELSLVLGGKLESLYPRLREELQASLWAELACYFSCQLNGAYFDKLHQRLSHLEAKLEACCRPACEIRTGLAAEIRTGSPIAPETGPGETEKKSELCLPEDVLGDLAKTEAARRAAKELTVDADDAAETPRKISPADNSGVPFAGKIYW